MLLPDFLHRLLANLIFDLPCLSFLLSTALSICIYTYVCLFVCLVSSPILLLSDFAEAISDSAHAGVYSQRKFTSKKAIQNYLCLNRVPKNYLRQLISCFLRLPLSSVVCTMYMKYCRYNSAAFDGDGSRGPADQYLDTLYIYKF